MRLYSLQIEKKEYLFIAPANWLYIKKFPQILGIHWGFPNQQPIGVFYKFFDSNRWKNVGISRSIMENIGKKSV